MKPKFIVLLVFVLSMVSLTYSSEIKRQNAFTKVDAPAAYYNQKTLLKSASLKYEIVYSVDFPLGEIRSAIDKAMEIWSYTLFSNQPIRISIKKADLGDEINASTMTNYYNFPSGTTIPGVKLGFQYPVSLAKALANSDLNAGLEGDEYYDMIITVNNKRITSNEFSYNIDGEPVSGKLDFITIIMHEIGHGLGISGSMQYNNVTNEGSHDFTNILAQKDKYFPTIFDNFALQGSQGQDDDRLLNVSSYSNPSVILGGALISNDLFFNGDKAKAAAQNNFPKLYAPTTWEAGSSFSHLDETKYIAGNSNSLMTPNTAFAEVIHSPGEICLAMLADIGWTVNRLITVISPAPGNVWARNQQFPISWTDNKKESIDIVLYQKSNDDKFYQASTLTSIIANNEIIGANTFFWTVGANVSDGLYKIIFQTGTEVFGESCEFAISDAGRVATPVVSPSTNTYTINTPIPVTITCPTLGADIYYTTDGSTPGQNSSKFGSTFYVTPPCTIKVKAYKGGVVPSDLVTVIYSYDASAVRFTKLDEQGQEFGALDENHHYDNIGFYIYSDNHWNFWDTPVTLKKEPFTIITDQDLIPNKSGVYQKFWKWTDDKGKNNILNWGTYDFQLVKEFSAHFKTPYTAKIQNTLEGFSSLTGDEILFKDPWKYDKQVSTVRWFNTNSGDQAAHISYPSPLTISPTSSLKGVMLGVTGINTGTTYSVKAKTDVTINGSSGKFFDWSSDGKATLTSPNSLESGVIFNAPDANVYARYKFVNKSNTATAFSNTSQRKFVRTDNGYLHLVYESMNHIWYERSTNNGMTWQIMNGGKNLDQGATQSKLP